MVQAHVYYSGTVQGVGFRYTVQRLAGDLRLTGWVKNLRDGRVEICAEGPKDSIEKLLSETDKYFEGYIRSKEITYHPHEGRFKEFLIAH